MNAYRIGLSCVGKGYASYGLDLGGYRTVTAWTQLHFLSSLANFDSDNAIAVDIPFVTSSHLPKPRVWNGRWGEKGSIHNVYPGAWTGEARYLLFRLRVMHHQDLEVQATAIVLVD